MEINYILLHGYTGRPERNFFPWLRKELVGKGFKVSVPKLPSPDNPDIMQQVKYVLNTEKIDSGTIILGHSLGGVVALKILEKLKKPVYRLVLVSSFSRPLFNNTERHYTDTIDWKFDFDKIKNNVLDIRILQDKNDKEVKKEYAVSLGNSLGVNVNHIEAKQEHFTALEEPDVLKVCL